MTKNWEKIHMKVFFISFFLSKIAIHISLGVQKGRPSYRRSLQPSIENIQHIKKCNLLTFFLFLCVIFALLDPDPGTPLNPDPIRIRIHNTERDFPSHCSLSR
jgi:hypothetical protein